MTAPLLAVDGLCIRLPSGAGIVEDVSLHLDPGELLALVGESGAGKTTTALALLGAAPPGASITAGRVVVAGQSLLDRPEADLRRLRSRLVAYVPQEPGSALNPARAVGRQIAEVVAVHAPQLDPRPAVAQALSRAGLPSDHAFQARYPYQLSGGQQQRVAIAQAIVLEPALLVLDEPTTGLDVLTQAALLSEIESLRRQTGVGIVYVTHDLAAVACLVDRLAVMYAGRIVEEGPIGTLLASPAHPYTAGLIASVPDPVAPRRLLGIPGRASDVGQRPPGCGFAPRCSQRIDPCEAAVPPLQRVGPGHVVRCPQWAQTPAVITPPLTAAAAPLRDEELLRVEGLIAVHRSRRTFVEAAWDITFALGPGECLALVGESGSGKTTIARCIAGLHRPAGGSILWRGEPLAPHARRRTREQRRRVQLVFQNPFESLNPRQRIGAAIARPARLLRGMTRPAAHREVGHLLELVRLPAAMAERYPGGLSGGEQQRVALARALAAEPELLICDEITSALDVSVQAAILDLLGELRAELSLAMLFISHDLGVVATIADQVIVLRDGTIQEVGAAPDVLNRPRTAYAQRLFASAPRLAGRSA